MLFLDHADALALYNASAFLGHHLAHRIRHVAYPFLANHTATPHRDIAHMLLGHHLAHCIRHFFYCLNGDLLAHLIRYLLDNTLLDIVSHGDVIDHRARDHHSSIAYLRGSLTSNKSRNGMFIASVARLRIGIALTRFMNCFGIARPRDSVLFNAWLTNYPAYGLTHTDWLAYGAHAVPVMRFHYGLIAGLYNIAIVCLIDGLANGIFACH
jgi:hypothetical protein